MHKQQRYLLLLLVANGATGVQAMERLLAKANQPQQFTSIIDEITAMSPRKTQPQESTQELVVKKKTQHAFDLSGTPTQLVARIQSLEKEVKEEVASHEALLAQQETLKILDAQRRACFFALSEKTKLPEAQARTLKDQQSGMVNRERMILLKEKALCRLIEASVEFANAHPVLAAIPREDFTPLLHAQLFIEKQQLKVEIGALNAAWKAINKQINPLAIEQKKLIKENDARAATLDELTRSINKSKKTISSAEAEKTQLLISLEEQRDAAQGNKAQFQDKAKALSMAIAEEKEKAAKIDLRTQLIGINREIATLSVKIDALDTAIAQAKGTSTGLFGWFTGK